MKTIAKLSEMIAEELEDSENYAKCALAFKETDLRLSDMFLSLSKQELEHSKTLHSQAVRLIGDYDEEPPEAMKAVWEWEHNKAIEEEKEIRLLQEMVKE